AASRPAVSLLLDVSPGYVSSSLLAGRAHRRPRCDGEFLGRDTRPTLYASSKDPSMNLSCRLASLALALSAATAGAQADLSTAKLVTLRNGLRVLLAPDSTATSVDVSMWCDAGTRTEPIGQSGITQVIERMRMRRPGPVRLRRELESRGGLVVSFT